MLTDKTRKYIEETYTTVEPKYFGNVMCYVHKRCLPPTQSDAFYRFLQTYKYLAEIKGIANLADLYKFSQEE